MCGIVGYIGTGLSRAHIIEGLSRLEYRGYDASGFGCLSAPDTRLVYYKSPGGIDALVKAMEKLSIDGHVGIGHLRWSTHGLASDVSNAHPVVDCTNKISIVHNGIIENYHELKTMLTAKGHSFTSQTDTETVAHLLESLIATHKTFKGAIIDMLSYLEGAYAFVCIMQDIPDSLLIVRKRSPLCIGIGDNEMFIASDPLAFAGKTHKVLFMPDESFALVRKDRIELYTFEGVPLPLTIEEYTVSATASAKGSFEHFMLKEIYEQKKVIYDTVNFVKTINTNIWDRIGLNAGIMGNLESMHLVGCGTSWHAGRIAQFFFETIAHIPTRVHLASEFRYSPFFPEKNSMFVAISQSGETADTLEALRMINETEIPTVALTNVASSSMVREATGFLLTQAGPEISVASTKAFTAQVSALYWLAHRIAYEKKLITARELEIAQEDLLLVAEILENAIETYKRQIITIDVPFYKDVKNFIFLGRHVSFPFALEAALKLKEIAYIFVDCYPAGELKHGSLALVDETVPVFLFSCLDDVVYQKLVSNAESIKSRSGHLVVFAFEGQDELIKVADKAFILPRVKPLLAPLAMTGLMQFFVYHMGVALARPIDKPRNLAKSVTVE